MAKCRVRGLRGLVGGKGRKFLQSKVTIIEGRSYRRLDVYSQLSDMGRLALTQLILAGDHAPWFVDTVSAKSDARMVFPNPALWWVMRHGVVDTAFGLRPIRERVRTRDRCARCASSRRPNSRSSAVSPAAEDRWRITTGKMSSWQPWRHLDQSRLGELYGYAADLAAPTPDNLAVQIGVNKTTSYPNDTYVTSDAPIYELAAAAHPAILVSSSDHAAALIERWGLHDAAELVNRAVLPAISGEAVSLIDWFPGLRVFPEAIIDIELFPCSDLSVEITTQGSLGPTVSEFSVLRDGESRVYFLDRLSDPELLSGLNDELRLHSTPISRLECYRLAPGVKRGNGCEGQE